ncbi:hypothetical protein HMPREF2976_09125 [Corynebacterium sp. HMSC077D10]|uniref:hypothetical protein n=1 Tax=unclassified Corynebacterium TaxID=2624378 RepID=UPI00079270B1|nr:MULTISPECIES: hypothetical protein [unclassified Corynebacterium]KXB54715.1 hypothetical protein HMPREF0307_01465 [Corynebacterium sp. DNF00584]OFL77001.1 hypothetical protein HMPREF2748_05450 [Corynebacterium sp. HMSC077B05]OFP19177.1 hypothetical protein HMPREF2998_10815 [Corynebacterium sp. HMSC065A05]OFP68063.1 hypothetical protein HMPREF2976_09125 [Corynebacterium sp. HMSC077D10]
MVSSKKTGSATARSSESGWPLIAGVVLLAGIVLAAVGFVAWTVWGGGKNNNAERSTVVVTQTASGQGEEAAVPTDEPESESSAPSATSVVPTSTVEASAETGMPEGLTQSGWSGTTAVCGDGETLAFAGRGPDGAAVVCASGGEYIYHSALFGGSLTNTAYLEGPTFYVPTDDSLITVSDGGFGVRQGGARVAGGEFTESWRAQG